jgi:hypothetical protein
MSKKFDNSPGQNYKNIARHKAKIVYDAIFSKKETIISEFVGILEAFCTEKDDRSLKIENLSPEEYETLLEFLEKEVGIVVWIIASREARRWFMRDEEWQKEFEHTLYCLFRDGMNIPLEAFQIYVQLGEKLRTKKKLDVIYMRIFSARIMAFLKKDEELFNYKETDCVRYIPEYMRYYYYAKAGIVTLFYKWIFYEIIQILQLYLGEKASIQQKDKILRKIEYILYDELDDVQEEIAKRVKKHMTGAYQEQIHDVTMNKLSTSLRRYTASVDKMINDLYNNPTMEPIKKYFEELSKNGTDQDVIPWGQGEFGLEITNPIPVCEIIDSFSYLSRLRTENGDTIEFERIGSTSTPDIEYPVDVYKITANNVEIATIYISPYHRKNSKKAPRGFKLIYSVENDKRQSSVSLKKSDKKSFLKKLFGRFQKRTLLDDVKELGEKVIPSGYRRIAQLHGCAPTGKTTEKKIMEIYIKVATAFKHVAKQRGAVIPALNLNFIVLKFLQVYEMMGDAVLDSHLQYETEKYLSEGLRPEYKQELKLF